MSYKYFIILLFIAINTIAQNKSNSVGFKENRGQIMDQNGHPNNAVKYLLNTNGLNVQLKKNGFSYDVYEVKKHPTKHHIQEKSTFPSLANDDKKVPDYTLEYVFHRIDIDFVNSNSNVQLISNEESNDYDNYYNVPNKPEGIVNVHQYQQITYKNIYPNIDVVFSIPKDSLKAVEYNFVVHPNGKISDIQLKFNGAKTELIDNKIKMQVRFGEMEETLPASWTEDGMTKKSIRVAYTKIKNNVYGFNTSNSVNGKTVIIDPVPVRLWGTYFGGNSGSFIRKIKTDKHGNIIIAGETSSSTNIATSGVFQSTKTSIWDASFFSKLDPDGKRIWGSYINSAKIYDIVINWNSEIYLGGSVFYTSGDNLSTLGAYKTSNLDFSSDGLLLSFNTNGYQIWGTLYGGAGNDWINTLSLDSQENLIIAGETHSTDGIVTSNAFQPNNNDPFDGCGFFAKFSIFGNRIYGSYFPGKINHSTVDNNDNLIFSGQYWILDADQPNISTPGTHQTQIHYMDGFIVKFNPSGQRSWCTYYGGDASFYISVNDYYDRITGIGTDLFNNIYVTGVTNSTNNIATVGAYKENLINNGVNSFLSKFNSDGIQQWGTYYGSDNSFSKDISESSFTTKDGNTYIAGNTRSTTNIATTNSFQPTNNGSDEGYISKFNTSGNLEWGTYYGGSNQDFLENIFYQNGNIYTIGHTTGSTNLGTLGTEYPTISGGSLFIAKFQECLTSPEISSNSPICIGNTLELKASGGTDYLWTGPNGFSSTDQNPIIPNATTLNSGQYTCLITGTGGCDDTKTNDVIVGDVEAPVPDLATLLAITGNCNTIVTTIPTATDTCAGAITATTTSPLNYNLPGTYTIVWNYNDGNGNSVNQNQTITITSQPLPTANTPQTFCIQQNATINNIVITGQNIKWYDALSNGNFLANTTSLQDGITYYASQTINGCESERIAVLVNIQNTAAPAAASNQSFCSTQNATLNDIEITGTNIKWYNSSNIEIPDTTLISDNTTYYATQTINGCESINKTAITTVLINTLNAINFVAEFCDENNDGKETINLSVFNPDLIANPTGNSFSYYTSLDAAENQIANNKVNNISNYVLPTGSYTLFVRIDSPNGCHQVVELSLNLYSKPIIPIDDIMPICEGSSITINAGAGYDNYLWSTGESSSTITIQNPGNYWVTVTNNYDLVSCSSTKDFKVKKSTIASITSIETQDWTDNENTIKVFVTGEGDFEYSIDGIHFQDSNEFSNVISGQYTVQVRDKNGCGTATENVFLLMYPKYFTPNGDGYNDTWKIKFSETEKNMTIKIFDRYGKLLKELSPNSSWTGQFNNQELPATDYWFIITRTDGKEYKGHFSLKR